MDFKEFDQFADEYYQNHKKNIAISGESPEYFHRYKIVETSNFLKKKGFDPGVILDFGAGIGNSIPYFYEFFQKSELVCADVSHRSLEIANKRYSEKAEMLLIRNDKIDLPTASVDLIFTACVFHHINEMQHTHWLTELRRVIRPGGFIVLFEHNPLNPLTVHAVNTCPFDKNAQLQKSGNLKIKFIKAGWNNPGIKYHVFFPGFLSFARKIESSIHWLPLGAQYSIMARA